MKELGFFYQAMLKLEAAGMSPIYMCGAFILETAGSTYPVDGSVIADHVAACMEEIPLMRQRLIQDPLKIDSLRLVEYVQRQGHARQEAAKEGLGGCPTLYTLKSVGHCPDRQYAPPLRPDTGVHLAKHRTCNSHAA